MPATNHKIECALPPEIRNQIFSVVPAYNEVACLEQVIHELASVYPNVVVIDDGSSDGTFDAARRCARFALRHTINRGQGAALQTGIEFAIQAGAKYIVTFDSDGQHRVEDIEALIAPIIGQETDIALGSRFLGKATNMPTSRKWLLKGAVTFTKLVNRVQLTDTHNGIRAFSRDAAKKIHITLDGMAHASEIIDQIRKSGFRYKEVPVEIRYTEYSLEKGQSPRAAIQIVLQYFLGRIMR